MKCIEKRMETMDTEIRVERVNYHVNQMQMKLQDFFFLNSEDSKTNIFANKQCAKNDIS